MGPVPANAASDAARPAGAQPPRGRERVPRGPVNPYRTRPSLPPAAMSSHDFWDGTLRLLPGRFDVRPELLLERIRPLLRDRFVVHVGDLALEVRPHSAGELDRHLRSE